ncbi:helix-turn-helix domain-containing protein [Pseudomonas fluorescens]|uniref:helix-turn-helix domain-containing protein n=1 Tax=Pseudomonas fluorescens TaxID=294 RepID=UPI003D225545
MPDPLSQKLLGGKLGLQLLPRAPYSARDPATGQTLGVTLERQQGVHAIDSDRRVDFDTWPGVLAYTPAGVEVFSESAAGGEYLLARWSEPLADEPSSLFTHRVQSGGHFQALTLGREARRLLLDPHAYLVEVRVQAARRLIERSSLPLAVIAQDSGFAHQSHMGSAFRKLLGMTPSQYRSRF